MNFDLEMHLVKQLKGADPAILDEIVREAESFLNSQLTSALAADQRAIAFTRLLGATTVVVSGAGWALLTRKEPDFLLGWLCVLLAVVLII
jgi:phosphoserine phosphatase